MILLPISHKLGEGLAEQLLEQHLVRVVVYVGTLHSLPDIRILCLNKSHNIIY